MDSVRARRTTVAVLVAAVVLVRVGLVLAVTAADDKRADSNDKVTYVQPARALLHDGHFDKAEDSSVPEFFRTPGYPAFLAVVYGVSDESDTAVYVVQALLSGLSVLLAIGLGRRLSGSWMVGLAAGVLVAVDPVQAAVQGFVGTEALATLLVTLTAYTGVRFAQSGLAPGWGAAYGLSLVAATYVRPTTFYFGLVAAALLAAVALRDPAHRRTVLRAGVALLAPCIVLLGLWNVRNHETIGSWRFSAVESVNLYWYRAADVVAQRDGIGFRDARVALTEDLHRDLEDDLGHRLDGLDRERLRRFDAERYASGQLPRVWEDHQGTYYGRAQRAGLHLIRSEPVLVTRQVAEGVYSQVVQSGWVSAFRYFTGDERPPAPVSAAGLLDVWAVELLAAVGMVVVLRRDREPGQLLAHGLTIALVAYTLVASAGPEAADGARFRTPVWPIWCVYAAIGGGIVAGRWREHRGATDESRP